MNHQQGAARPSPSKWASKSLANVNDAAGRRISAILGNASEPSSKDQPGRWAPDPNEARSFETDQQPSRSHRVPLLSGPKGWHILSIQFPRHCVVAHEFLPPRFLERRVPGPEPASWRRPYGTGRPALDPGAALQWRAPDRCLRQKNFPFENPTMNNNVVPNRMPYRLIK